MRGCLQPIMLRCGRWHRRSWHSARQLGRRRAGECDGGDWPARRLGGRRKRGSAGRRPARLGAYASPGGAAHHVAPGYSLPIARGAYVTQLSSLLRCMGKEQCTRRLASCLQVSGRGSRSCHFPRGNRCCVKSKAEVRKGVRRYSPESSYGHAARQEVAGPMEPTGAQQDLHARVAGHLRQLRRLITLPVVLVSVGMVLTSVAAGAARRPPSTSAVTQRVQAHYDAIIYHGGLWGCERSGRARWHCSAFEEGPAVQGICTHESVTGSPYCTVGVTVRWYSGHLLYGRLLQQN